jgi:hypothetical protein
MCNPRKPDSTQLGRSYSDKVLVTNGNQLKLFYRQQESIAFNDNSIVKLADMEPSRLFAVF